MGFRNNYILFCCMHALFGKDHVQPPAFVLLHQPVMLSKAKWQSGFTEKCSLQTQHTDQQCQLANKQPRSINFTITVHCPVLVKDTLLVTLSDRGTPDILRHVVFQLIHLVRQAVIPGQLSIFSRQISIIVGGRYILLVSTNLNMH